MPPMARTLGPLRGWLLAAAVLSCSLITPRPAAAQDDEEVGASYAVMAVQNRQYGGSHELHIQGGLLPLDAFTKGAAVNGGYTLHFSNLVAWEVIHYVHAFHYDTDLRGKLETFEIQEAPFEVVDTIATSSLVWKPIYWKGAFLNDTILHGEFFGLLGGGVGFFSRSERPAVNAGVGTRVFFNEWLSLRVDIRHHWFFEDSVLDFKLHDELFLGLGLAATL